MGWDLVRIVNALLVVYCVIGMIPAYAWWSTQPRATRFLLLALAGLIVATGYAAVEAIVLEVEGGARVLVYTPALAWAAYGITTLTHSSKEPS